MSSSNIRRYKDKRTSRLPTHLFKGDTVYFLYNNILIRGFYIAILKLFLTFAKTYTYITSDTE